MHSLMLLGLQLWHVTGKICIVGLPLIPEAVPPGVFTFASGRKPAIHASSEARAHEILADLFFEASGNALLRYHVNVAD